MAVEGVEWDGGEKLDEILANIGKGGVREVRVGFFKTAEYDTTPPISVATVAAYNEFGTRRGIPERPFFRRAIKKMKPGVSNILITEIDPTVMTVDKRLAGRIGNYCAGELRASIIELKTPPNAPSTQKAKRAKGRKTAKGNLSGDINPLIDTGLMHTSATYSIIDGVGNQDIKEPGGAGIL